MRCVPRGAGADVVLAPRGLFDQRNAIPAHRSPPREPAAGVVKRALRHARLRITEGAGPCQTLYLGRRRCSDELQGRAGLRRAALRIEQLSRDAGAGALLRRRARRRESALRAGRAVAALPLRVLQGARRVVPEEPLREPARAPGLGALRRDSDRRDRAIALDDHRALRQKRGRDYVVNETDLLDADGRLLVRGRTHQSFLPSGGAPKAGFVVDEKTAQDKATREARAPFPSGNGEAIAGDREGRRRTALLDVLRARQELSHRPRDGGSSSASRTSSCRG